MFKKSCQILVYKGERKLPWKKFQQFGYTYKVVLNLHSARTEAFAKSLKKGGNIDKCLPQSTFKQCLI